MALQKCPECRHKISDSAKSCPHCGFSFAEADLAVFREKMEQRRQHNARLNQQNVKVQLIWLAIFALIIGIGVWWNG